jgi:GNAT superfamily N-acetyltransferase
MNIPSSISIVEKLAVHHQTSTFKCGKNSLDLFIRKHALINQRANSSQTYVVHLDNVVMGYYSLVFSSVKQEDSPAPIQAAMPANYPVPVMLFARFAVEKKFQGRGLGKALLKDAFLRTVGASEIGGLAAILVDAIDDKMVAFYKNYGFTECPAGERTLMIAMKDVRDHLSGVADSGGRS